ncbi:DUF2868 domain-containing protein [Pigmentiphaga aceris]|uniref:DUF2868 domain-containing protein n=1 Tax=Pigmentiphaga aceris TaxID=1940612 RepID=A0A5C0AX68_9BURK|nr:DUF2868 domain-containing protein [Pigmentiphaga aceris]QEI07072.1 DUF2868 domain-containing protein [Pigmentiphaga aceris]
MSHWLVEAVRLRESLWGPLADDAEMRALRARELPLDAALTQRAAQLAAREGLVEAVRTWRGGANLAALLLGVVAVLLGAGTATAALGDASRPVNLLWAVSGLLGLHVLTLFLWLGGLAWSLATGAGSGGALGKLWLVLARRAARGPAGALAPQSLVNLMARARLLPWLLGGVSHAIWLLALGAALVTLLAMLATRRYDFVWETTILDPGYVERLALWLGSLPGMLGLPTPDAALIRASDGVATQPADGRAIWAGWLLGVVAVYGVLPRALALLICVWKVRRGVNTLTVDMSLPGLDTLEARLRPASRRTGVIDPAPAGEWVSTHASHAAQASSRALPESNLFDGSQSGVCQSGLNQPGLTPPGSNPQTSGAHDHPGLPADTATHEAASRHVRSSGQQVAPGQAWLISVELPEDLRATQTQSPSVYDAGVIDSGPQREAAIERLHAARPARLLVVCDARQTPDRGTVALVAELIGLAAESRILLAGSAKASPSRRQAWVDRLSMSELGGSIAGSEADVWDWLATGSAKPGNSMPGNPQLPNPQTAPATTASPQSPSGETLP